MQPKRKEVSSQVQPMYGEEIHKPKETMKEEEEYKVGKEKREKIELFEDDESLKITLTFVKLP